MDVHAENTLSSSKSTEFDIHLPLGSLYRCLYPNIAPLTEAYLTPEPSRVAFWKKKLTELGPGPYIGISWTSPHIRPVFSSTLTRIEEWSPILANRDVMFVNLQSGDYENDLAVAKRDFGVVVHNFDDLDLYDDFDDVAALCNALDIVISVGTAVAAIASGVGTPTWLFSLPHNRLKNIRESFRGPSVLYFQRNIGETWDKVSEAIAEHLRLHIIENTQ